MIAYDKDGNIIGHYDRDGNIVLLPAPITADLIPYYEYQWRDL